MRNKNFTKLTIILLLFAAGGLTSVSAQVVSQKLGRNPFRIDPSAALQIDGTDTNKGFLPPRMATSQRTALVSPAKGLMVYDLGMKALMVNIGTSKDPVWKSVNTLDKETIHIIKSPNVYDIKANEYTVLADIPANATLGVTFNFPSAVENNGKIFVIGKLDDTGFPLKFSPGLTLNGTKDAIRELNYTKEPFRVQSDGTNWVIIDNF